MRSAARATPPWQRSGAQQLSCLQIGMVTLTAQPLRRTPVGRAVLSSKFLPGGQLRQTAQLLPPAQRCMRQPCSPRSSPRSYQLLAEALVALQSMLQVQHKAADAQVLHSQHGSHPASQKSQVHLQIPQLPYPVVSPLQICESAHA